MREYIFTHFGMDALICASCKHSKDNILGKLFVRNKISTSHAEVSSKICNVCTYKCVSL